MPLQWTAEDEDVNFTAYLSIEMVLNDEQISELIYLCRKSKPGLNLFARMKIKPMSTLS